jgi:hypothetical protein
MSAAGSPQGLDEAILRWAAPEEVEVRFAPAIRCPEASKGHRRVQCGPDVAGHSCSRGVRSWQYQTSSRFAWTLRSHRPVILVSFSTGFSASGLACPVRIRHLFRWFSRATLGAMPLWLLTYKFTCSQAECGYHNALDAVAQADTPKTAASQVGKSQHLCGRCGRPLTDSSSLKMAVPVPISSGEKKRSVSESGKQPSQNRGSR